MAVESATVINQLNASWPTSSDYIYEGDDHVRLIKSLLKAQFPGSTLLGLNAPVAATEAEFSYLVGVTSSIQTQLDNLAGKFNAPAGTSMLFYQAAAPLGWTISGAINDSMLRLVSSGGGTSGGTSSPISLSLAHTHATTGHVLTIAEMPAHGHRLWVQGTSASGGDNESPNYPGTGITGDDQTAPTYRGSTTTNNLSEVTGSGSSHSHGDTATALTDWAPKYSNVILCVKD
jgi:hypothetical protein